MYHTLAKRHKMSLRKLFSKYGQEFEHKEDLHNIFPLKSSIASLKKTQLSFTKCSVENCSNSNIEIHHVRALKTRIEKNNFSVQTTKGKRVSGWKAYMISKNRKQIALCDIHHDMIHADKLIFKDKKYLTLI